MLLIWILLVGLVTSKSQYQVVRTQKYSSNVTLHLKYTGDVDYYILPTSPIIKNLIFAIITYTYYDFQIKITDADHQRFQVPNHPPFPVDAFVNFSYPLNFSAIKFQYTESPFDFKIVRKANNAILFSTESLMMIYSSYYLQFGTEIASGFMYGLGEVQSGFQVEGREMEGHTIDDGIGAQAYEYCPAYMIRQNNNYFHVNYFKLDVIKQNVQGKHLLTYRTIGGIINFRVFLGDQSPLSALQKFHSFLGRSTIAPFWSYGAHQSRWGYKNITYLQNVIKNHKENDLPLDVRSDIDYMLDYKDFTIDQSRFPLDQLQEIIDDYNYCVILDAGIGLNNGYPYEEGRRRDVFIKDAVGNEQHGEVWPGKTAFVDFWHPNAVQYWVDMLAIFRQKLKFKGIWLDMDENSNFCNGPCETPTQQSIFDFQKDLPYSPCEGNIQNFSIPLNSTHNGDVLSIRDLSNIFRLVIGFKLDVSKSNSTDQFYQARGAQISIQNYSDESKISKCLSRSCNYYFNIDLNIAKQQKQLNISVLYLGQNTLNEQMIINEIQCYFNGEIRSLKLQVEPLKIQQKYISKKYILEDPKQTNKYKQNLRMQYQIEEE